MHLQNDAKKQPVEAYLNSRRSAPADPVQELLTRTHIIPHLPSLLLDFERLREAIDMAVNQFSILQHGHPLKNLHVLPSIDAPQIFYGPMLQSTVNSLFNRLPRKILTNYPVGQCTRITTAAWRLLNDEPLPPQTEGFARLQTFISSGGTFQVIWGGIRHTYFQTAFQAGDYYFDISNDTVHVHKPKIAHAILKESGFHDIHSYMEYMRIKSEYHQVEIFINNCFPKLFPYFPLFTCSKINRQFRFAVDSNMYMARLNISTRFRTIFDAMDAECLKNPLDKMRLRQVGASVKKITAGRNVMDLLEFRVMDKDEMVRLLQSGVSLDLSEHIERLKAAKKICGFLNYFWAKGRSESQP